MFQIDFGSDGQIICIGRLDAAQCEKERRLLIEPSPNAVEDSGENAIMVVIKVVKL